jgi:hypothetical protein
LIRAIVGAFADLNLRLGGCRTEKEIREGLFRYLDTHTIDEAGAILRLEAFTHLELGRATSWAPAMGLRSDGLLDAADQADTHHEVSIADYKAIIILYAFVVRYETVIRIELCRRFMVSLISSILSLSSECQYNPKTSFGRSFDCIDA